jgi:hypothetical protein
MTNLSLFACSSSRFLTFFLSFSSFLARTALSSSRARCSPRSRSCSSSSFCLYSSRSFVSSSVFSFEVRYFSHSLQHRLKGLCHEMNIFWKVLKIKSVLTFCICANSFKFFCCLVMEKIKENVLAGFYENTY